MTNPTNDTRSLDELFDDVWGRTLDAVSDDFRDEDGSLKEKYYQAYKNRSKEMFKAAINAETLRQFLEMLNKFDPTGATKLKAQLAEAAIEKWGEKK